MFDPRITPSIIARASGAAAWGSKLGPMVVPAATAIPTATINVTNTLRMGVFFFLKTPHHQSLALIQAASRWRRSSLRIFLERLDFAGDVAGVCGYLSSPGVAISGALRVSVLLTRRYAPSGDFTDLLTRREPAIGSATMKRELKLSSCTKPFGDCGDKLRVGPR